MKRLPKPWRTPNLRTKLTALPRPHSLVCQVTAENPRGREKVVGGKYMTDSAAEFPRAWFRGAKLSPRGADAKLNCFGVTASQPLSVWRAKGWIHPDDPRGWFQWYCRYYRGRRLGADDQRQIKRWKAMRRHIAQIEHNCDEGDTSCRRRQRQALLHWAYDSRKI